MNEQMPNPNESKKPRLMFVKSAFLQQIESGEKTLEVRVGYASFKNISPGQILEFRSSTSLNSVLVKAVDLRRYPTLELLMEKEDTRRIMPGATKTQMIGASHALFKPEDVPEHGLVVIEFKKQDV